MQDKRMHDPTTFGQHNTERERLFRLVAAVATLFDRDVVIETVASLLDTRPVEDADCVAFDDIAIRFGTDGKVKSVFRTVDGSWR
jgi:hypothetical protein